MHYERIEAYVEKVFGYAVSRTYSRDEAEELSQEILLTALRELANLRDDSHFDAWFWGIARNVTHSFRRRMGKQRAMFAYDVPEHMLREACPNDEQDEFYAMLRQKIAMLSAIYRDVIILYYYDGLSVKDIARKLSIPEGTVAWRLKEARSKLKKECTDMNETALRPVYMWIDIYGSGNYDGERIPFPSAWINDALSQNILYRCYDQAMSPDELAEVCGVPAFYVEDCVKRLVDRNALITQGKNRFRTDFIIFSNKHGAYRDEHEDKLLDPIMDSLVDALDAIAREAAELDFYRAEKSESDLYYLYGAMAFAYAAKHYSPLAYPPIPCNYDGYRWRYAGGVQTDNKHRGVSVMTCDNNDNPNGMMHAVYAPGDFATRPMMYDNYINACDDLLKTGCCKDTDSVALAVRDGYIRRKENGSFAVTVPAFTAAQKEAFHAIALRHLEPLMPQYAAIVTKLASGYKKLFPEHLADDAQRYCEKLFVDLYANVIAYAQRSGRAKKPSPDYICDVLIQK